MFAFVVKRLGFLKAIPLMAIYYDSLLKLWILVSNPKMLHWIDELEDFGSTLPETNISLHKYGGSQFNYHEKEIAHLHSNGILDILLNQQLKRNYLKFGKIENHHVFENSGWVSFYIKTAEDVNYAKELIEMAYHKQTRNKSLVKN